MMVTHTELNQRAVKWLFSQGCSVVASEIKCWNNTGEIIDALGFTSQYSILVECKASRNDFLADKHKPFRKEPERGVGQLRYYLCPPDIIKTEDLPERWGLLYTRGTQIKKVIYPHAYLEEKKFEQPFNHLSERTILLSVCRRLGVYEKGIEGKVFFKEKMIPEQQPAHDKE